ELRTPEAREEFFKKLSRLGVVGAKIDFFDHEHKEIVDLYTTLLREAAKHHLMVNFHGANKPTGEARTWPNELTREAVRGMESSRLRERARHGFSGSSVNDFAGGCYTGTLYVGASPTGPIRYIAGKDWFGQTNIATARWGDYSHTSLDPDGNTIWTIQEY